MTYIPPTVFASKFTCPHCSAIAAMAWQARGSDFADYGKNNNSQIRIATCAHCGEYTLWHMETMVYPDLGLAPPPNPDMPKSVQRYYTEAATIAAKSPRAAAAILRLALHELCQELGEPGKSINGDIAALVQKGLPRTVQQSLDLVRVTGNNAVHPGQIDVDDAQVVGHLFSFLNVIVEYMVSLPNRVNALYGNLPTVTRQQIERRDRDRERERSRDLDATR